MTDRLRHYIAGVPIDLIGWGDAISKISGWSQSRESRVVCICNAHSVITAVQDGEFLQLVERADMATPDGAPIAWMLRHISGCDQSRINGPDLMWRYCAYAQDHGDSIYLYGATPETLNALRRRLAEHFPMLRIAGYHSPPFRCLTDEEDELVVRRINESGAGVVWVSLGCPKQEKWMDAHRSRIHAVMIGVGAAFDYHAGTLKRAPLWMQRNGLEWLYRLVAEPRRLWRRYLVTNSLFLFYAGSQIFMSRSGEKCGNDSAS